MPLTSAQKNARLRERRRTGVGGERMVHLSIWLPEPAVIAMRRLALARGCTQRALVAQLLLDAAQATLTESSSPAA